MVTRTDATPAPKTSGVYTLSGYAVSVTLKLRRDGKDLKTLPISGAKSDPDALAAKIAAAIEDAVPGL